MHGETKDWIEALRFCSPPETRMIMHKVADTPLSEFKSVPSYSIASFPSRSHAIFRSQSMPLLSSIVAQPVLRQHVKPRVDILSLPLETFLIRTLGLRRRASIERISALVESNSHIYLQHSSPKKRQIDLANGIASSMEAGIVSNTDSHSAPGPPSRSVGSSSSGPWSALVMCCISSFAVEGGLVEHNALQLVQQHCAVSSSTSFARR